MVGMYIKHVDKAFCDYFQTMDNCAKEEWKARDESNDVTPLHGKLPVKSGLLKSWYITSLGASLEVVFPEVKGYYCTFGMY